MNLTDSLRLIFVDGVQGDSGCILCYIEWLARLLGFELDFSMLHQAAMSEQRDTDHWPYYADIINTYSPGVVDIIAHFPILLWNSLATMNDWTPALLALSDGTRDQVTVTQEMVDGAMDVLDGLEAEANSPLRPTIQREQIALDIPSFVGLNMEEAWATVVKRAPIERQFFPIFVR